MINQKVEELLSKLTLAEKVSLLAGKDMWSTVAIERLGIPSLTVCDGPHGVRIGEDGVKNTSTTSFPTGTALAATWNPELVEKVGIALAEEAAALDCDILLGPAVNIIRHPLAGRNFECFSEDPLLAGLIACGYIKGVQSRGIGTCLKHFACNSQETERSRGNSVVDERTMREIYLPAFEMAVKDTQPWSMMCGYNRLNGTYCAENNYLQNEILRNEWGFEGAVISDWGATHSGIESVNAGLDLEMPGPAKHFKTLAESVKNWQMDEAAIDKAAARIIRLVVQSGKMVDSKQNAGYAVGTPEHLALAREVAAESMVLLKNKDAVLPLDAKAIKSIAVIGPNADDPQFSGGGSGEINTPCSLAVPLNVLKEELGDTTEIKHTFGCVNYENPPLMSVRYLTPSQGEGHGLWGEYFNNPDFAGEPIMTKLEKNMNIWWGTQSPHPDIEADSFSARWTGTLNVPVTAKYTLRTFCQGYCKIYLGGELIIEQDSAASDIDGYGNKFNSSHQFEADSSKSYELRMEYRKKGEGGSAAMLYLGIAPEEKLDHELENAVELAKNSDVAVVFAGISRRYENEGSDRPALELPGRQNELIAAVAKANPRTIVVLNTGAPYIMPWLDDAAAVLNGWLYGVEGARAIVDILFGKVNPSGKLPITYPKRLEDTPAFLDFPGGRDVHYGEGIFVGYRYYDKRDVEPLFPFGYGLSYTTFEYSDLKVPENVTKNEPVNVSVTVKNTGKVRGKEIVQLYVRDCECSVTRPPKELKAFAKVDLEPGEAREVHFSLDHRAFAFYCPHEKGWKVEPGQFEIRIGGSALDIKLETKTKIS